mmetsp:Transcript_8370/g.19723  ORF Transcript_8370/g.19723 Transcript_8370/m.19723 type:complete len:205 (+) Transcript_8370:866-1480(+)
MRFFPSVRPCRASRSHISRSKVTWSHRSRLEDSKRSMKTSSLSSACSVNTPVRTASCLDSTMVLLLPPASSASTLACPCCGLLEALLFSSPSAKRDPSHFFPLSTTESLMRGLVLCMLVSNHSMPSFSPSPVLAHVACTCHGRSVTSCKRSASVTSSVDMALAMSCLFAQMSTGTPRNSSSRKKRSSSSRMNSWWSLSRTVEST